MVILATTYMVIRPTIPTVRQAKSARYWVEGADQSLTGQLVHALNQAGYKPALSARSQADIVISRGNTPGALPIQLAPIGQPAKLETGSIIAPATAPGYYLSSTTRPALAKQLAGTLKTAPANSWTLNAVGDIIIGRTVYLQMQRTSMLAPFSYFADTLKSADLTLADLECTISDAHTIITDGGMTFASPFAATAGITASGIDAVNLANNHSFNVGAEGFTDTLDAMKRLGIGTFGGGRSDTEAHTPLILTTHGVKIALLGYSSIVGSTAAGADTPGMAHLSMAPWDPFSEAEAARMEADIRAAKQHADLVMVYYHWGTEYTHDANADQREIAHRAIDAGADLILGTHPHWVQGVEWYKNRLITYSLGNFVFDQECSAETKQGTMLKATFDGQTLTGAELVPYVIQDYQQPRPTDAATGQKILGDVFTHSWWP